MKFQTTPGRTSGNPAIYLAIVDGQGNVQPLSAEGEAVIRMELGAGVYSFGLMGACNSEAQWEEVSVHPRVMVTWQVEPALTQEEPETKENTEIKPEGEPQTEAEEEPGLEVEKKPEEELKAEAEEEPEEEPKTETEQKPEEESKMEAGQKPEEKSGTETGENPETKSDPEAEPKPEEEPGAETENIPEGGMTESDSGQKNPEDPSADDTAPPTEESETYGQNDSDDEQGAPSLSEEPVDSASETAEQD